MIKRIDFNRWFSEIIVIVMGILIALSVDEYRQYLNDRELEQTYLSSLLIDLNRDLEEIKSIIDEAEIRLESGEYILSISPDKAFSDYKEVKKILNNINSTGFFAVHKPVRITIDDLISSGKLQIIENIELKRKIQNYYQSWLVRSDYDLWSRRLVWEEFRNEYTRLVPYDLIAADNEQEVLAVAPNALKSLFSDTNFLYRLRNAHGTSRWQKSRYERYHNQLEELIADLELERQTHE